MFFKISRDWDYYMNIAGTELPLQDVNDFISNIKESKIPFSIESMSDLHDSSGSHRSEWIKQRWSYKYKEMPTR